MALPEIVLDDRNFQDLVNEARLRISRSCPEWTDHNVSDPGITLVELFAWMTEMLIYRVNRIPEKLHVTLLELLGIGLAPPSAATTKLRFRLSALARESVSIPAGDTEVGTVRTASEESVVFQTSEGVTIPPIEPVAYVVEHGGNASHAAIPHAARQPPEPAVVEAVRRRRLADRCRERALELDRHVGVGGVHEASIRRPHKPVQVVERLIRIDPRDHGSS